MNHPHPDPPPSRGRVILGYFLYLRVMNPWTLYDNCSKKEAGVVGVEFFPGFFLVLFQFGVGGCEPGDR